MPKRPRGFSPHSPVGLKVVMPLDITSPHYAPWGSEWVMPFEHLKTVELYKKAMSRNKFTGLSMVCPLRALMFQCWVSTEGKSRAYLSVFPCLARV